MTIQEQALKFVREFHADGRETLEGLECKLMTLCQLLPTECVTFAIEEIHSRFNDLRDDRKKYEYYLSEKSSGGLVAFFEEPEPEEEDEDEYPDYEFCDGDVVAWNNPENSEVVGPCVIESQYACYSEAPHTYIVQMPDGEMKELPEDQLTRIRFN